MIHSFLMIGQSNMAGRGKIEEAPLIDGKHIFVLKNGRWRNMFRPINFDSNVIFSSLAESFAEKYAQKNQVDVGLIGCAEGGSRLDEWTEGSLLYDNAVAQARLAMRTSKIVGILWHQGESDCREELRTTYAERFKTFISALRRDLDLTDVPLIIGGLGDFLGKCTADPWVYEYKKMNFILEELAKEVPKAIYVSAEGLTSNEDLLHFNAKSLYEFGIRYFKAFEQLKNTIKEGEEK